MNFSQQSDQCLDSLLMQSVIKIMSTLHTSAPQIQNLIESRSFIKIKNKTETQVNNLEKIASDSIRQSASSFNSN